MDEETRVDVDALVAHADRDFPALFQLFAGYLDERWRSEHETWEEAVDSFLIEAPPHLREDAAAELDRLLRSDLDEHELSRLLFPGLGCGVVPSAQGLSSWEWLSAVRARFA